MFMEVMKILNMLNRDMKDIKRLKANAQSWKNPMSEVEIALDERMRLDSAE